MSEIRIDLMNVGRCTTSPKCVSRYIQLKNQGTNVYFRITHAVHWVLITKCNFSVVFIWTVRWHFVLNRICWNLKHRLSGMRYQSSFFILGQMLKISFSFITECDKITAVALRTVEVFLSCFVSVTVQNSICFCLFASFIINERNIQLNKPEASPWRQM